MNHQTVETHTNLARHYADVRARLYGPRPVVRRINLPAAPMPIYVDPIDEATPADCPLNMLLMPSWRFLAAYAAVKHGVAKGEIVGRSRKPNVVRARNEAIHLCRTHIAGTALTRLGIYFERDHTTILSALRKHARTMAEIS